MDPATRRHIRLQIDAAARKREGLRPRKVTRRVQVLHGSKSNRWSDGEIKAIVQRCADELGVPRRKLRQAQYRNWRAGDPGSRPNTQTVQDRLGSKRLA